MASGDGVIERLIDYTARARTAELPPDVLRRAKHHVLDTLAAMISGTQLRPGQLALEYARLEGSGRPEAQVVASDMVLPVIPAAIANGMQAHTDETDDSNGSASFHPGCAILPAALAMAERMDASGAELVNAVVLGYDIGARTNKALGPQAMRHRNRLPFSIGGTLGATAAAGCLAGLSRPEQYRYLYSYGAQQASGVMTYARDTEHIEKAFIFGGMPARNGLTATMMIQPEQLVAELGSRFGVMLTNIKKYCVGFPVQCAMEELLLSVEEHRFSANDVEKIVALLDGEVSFMAAHDVDHMNEPMVRSLRSRISVVSDAQLVDGEHAAIVETTLKDGRTLTKRVDSFRGKADNPLTTEEVKKKAQNLIAPVMGASRATRLIETVRTLEQLPTARDLRPLLALASP